MGFLQMEKKTQLNSTKLIHQFRLFGISRGAAIYGGCHANYQRTRFLLWRYGNRLLIAHNTVIRNVKVPFDNNPGIGKLFFYSVQII
jgi:hypothetical protein